MNFRYMCKQGLLYFEIMYTYTIILIKGRMIIIINRSFYVISMYYVVIKSSIEINVYFYKNRVSHTKSLELSRRYDLNIFTL